MNEREQPNDDEPYALGVAIETGIVTEGEYGAEKFVAVAIRTSNGAQVRFVFRSVEDAEEISKHIRAMIRKVRLHERRN